MSTERTVLTILKRYQEDNPDYVKVAANHLPDCSCMPCLCFGALDGLQQPDVQLDPRWRALRKTKCPGDSLLPEHKDLLVRLFADL
jgi:hypothetical protein